MSALLRLELVSDLPDWCCDHCGQPMTELYEIPHSMNLYCASCAFFFSTQMKKAAQQVWQLHHGTVTHTGLRYEDGTVIQKGVTQEREVGAAGGWTSDGRMEGTAAVHREKNKEAL